MFTTVLLQPVRSSSPAALATVRATATRYRATGLVVGTRRQRWGGADSLNPWTPAVPCYRSLAIDSVELTEKGWRASLVRPDIRSSTRTFIT